MKTQTTLPGMLTEPWGPSSSESLTLWAERSWQCRDLSDAPAAASAAPPPGKSWRCSVLLASPSALSWTTGTCAGRCTASKTRREKPCCVSVGRAQPTAAVLIPCLRSNPWMVSPASAALFGSGTGWCQPWATRTTLTFPSPWTWTWGWKLWSSERASSSTSCTLRDLHHHGHQDRWTQQISNYGFKKILRKLDWVYSQPSIVCKYISLLLLIMFIWCWLWQVAWDCKSTILCVFQLSICLIVYWVE